jgi:hypothetical protein
VKRPIRDAAEPLIVAFRSFYCSINVFGTDEFDCVLETGYALTTKIKRPERQ